MSSGLGPGGTYPSKTRSGNTFRNRFNVVEDDRFEDHVTIDENPLFETVQAPNLSGQGAAVTPPLSGRAAPHVQQSDHGDFSDMGQSFSRDGVRYSAPPHRGAAVPLGWSPSQSRPTPRTFVPMDVTYGIPRSMGRSSLS